MTNRNAVSIALVVKATLHGGGCKHLLPHANMYHMEHVFQMRHERDENVQVHLDIDLHHRIRVGAAKAGRTNTDVLNAAVRDWLSSGGGRVEDAPPRGKLRKVRMARDLHQEIKILSADWDVPFADVLNAIVWRYTQHHYPEETPT